MYWTVLPAGPLTVPEPVPCTSRFPDIVCTLLRNAVCFGPNCAHARLASKIAVKPAIGAAPVLRIMHPPRVRGPEQATVHGCFSDVIPWERIESQNSEALTRRNVWVPS